MLAEQFAHDLDLPVGHHTIEASAGTGKTFALVGLAARFIAEGRTTAADLLLVTFSRASTLELRARLLKRLTTVDRQMQRAIDGTPRDEMDLDPVETALLDASGGELRARAGRIREALRDLDTATVTTIHGLCAELLQRTGEGLDTELADVDDVALDSLLSDVVHRVVGSRADAADVLPEEQQARSIVRAGLSAPRGALIPDCYSEWMGTRAGLNGCIAKAANLTAEAMRRDARTHTYDDLLHVLRTRLEGPAGSAAIDGSRPLYRVGLVDEFQDTDPVQWAILQHLFPDRTGADGRTLVMVADPKQSIYAFRGADVTTYLAVRGDRPDHTLTQNWRADDPVVRAGATLFEGCDLGEGIQVHPIKPERGVRLHPSRPAIHIRVATDAAPTPRGRRGYHLTDPTREYIAADAAAHTVTLLHEGFEVDAEDGRRGLRPDDITVLVRTNAQAAMVQRQLGLRGVPSVLNGVGNVLRTRAARDWLTLLRALHQPTRGGPARLASLTDLLGGTPAALARSQAISRATDEDGPWVEDASAEALHVQLHQLAAILETDGVAALLRSLDEDGMTSRLITQPDGVRRLVDLQHVGELIHGQARGHGLAVSGLIAWLEQAVATASDVAPESHARRLADAGSAVEVMTAHSAKGLERGVVLAPYLWDPPRFREEVLRFVDEDGTRRVDVGGQDEGAPDLLRKGRSSRMRQAKLEEAREEMRLAYVAVTRARHHVVLWWGSAGQAATSPLAAMLGHRSWKADAGAALDGAMTLAERHPDLFMATAVESVPDETRWSGPTEVAPEHPVPVLSTLGRDIDRGWRRTSYSGLMRTADERTARDLLVDDGVPGATDDGLVVVPAGVDDVDAVDDEPVPAAPAGTSDSPEVILSRMPGGSEVGSAVHGVLEHVDFAAEDLGQALDDLLDAHLRGTSVDASDEEMRARVLEGLTAAVCTPLGPAVGDIALRDLTRDRRFDELAFEIPVLDGEAATTPGTVTLGHVADLLDEHLPADDPLAGYAAHLRDGHGPIEMRGFLTGFIDLLARVPGAGADDPDRFLVADYKTNRLGDGSDPVLRVAHHDRDAMVTAMVEHHYPIQALLYLVAAHRFLRWRVPGYRLERDLVGAGYLFLRGMTGPDTERQPDGTPHGVMLWTPPSALIADLDHLLAVGPSRPTVDDDTADDDTAADDTAHEDPAGPGAGEEAHDG